MTLPAAGTMGGTSKCSTPSPDALSENQDVLQCQEARKDGHRQEDGGGLHGFPRLCGSYSGQCGLWLLRVKLLFLPGAPAVPGRWHMAPAAGSAHPMPTGSAGRAHARGWLLAERDDATALDKHESFSSRSMFNQICRASGHSWGKNVFRL